MVASWDKRPLSAPRVTCINRERKSRDPGGKVIRQEKAKSWKVTRIGAGLQQGNK